MNPGRRAPKRVCVVAYTHYRSDPRVRREAEALARRGDRVTVLALCEPDRPESEDVNGVRVVGFPLQRHRGGLFGYAFGYGRFFARAAAHLTWRWRHYDLVHVHSLPEAMVFASLAPKALGTPVLLDVHDLSTEVFASRRAAVPAPVRVVERLALAFADRVVTVHDDYRDRIAARGVDPDDITVVLNTPDDALFPLRAPAIPTRPLRLIYHGTLVARYGLTAAVQAMAAIRHRLPDTTLQLVGDGDLRPELVRLISELQLEDCVHLSPASLPLDVIPERVAACNVGLVPFIDDPFTQAILPTKLLEYVRMGLPVVASRNPVIERYFDDGDLYLVKPGDTEQIVAAIERIAADPHDAVLRAKRAQRFFETEDWPVTKQRFLAAVDAMTDRRE